MSFFQKIKIVTIKIATITTLLFLTPALPAFAEDTFSITIPKSISLSGSGETEFNVSGTANLSEEKKLTVTTGKSLTLKDDCGKGTVQADVELDAIRFTSADNNTTAKSFSGNIIPKATLTAGEWNGTITFDIAVNNLEPGLYDAKGNLLCSWEDSGIDVENDKDCESEEPDSAHCVLTKTYPTTTKIIIPNSVTSIASEAFCSCNGLKNIIIPNSVTSIENYAFEYCSGLTSITIPSSVTSIRNYAFSGCSGLTSINVDSNNSSYSSSNGILFNKNKTTLIYCPKEKSGSITIPSSVTSIKDSAFGGCTNLTSITIPSSVTSIGNGAFSGCTSLTSITIPNSVTSIGNYAFESCSKLASITIPSSVTSIENRVFRDCSNLTSITIPNSVTSIGSHAFDRCTSLTSITIPNSVTSIGIRAFRDCSKLDVTFENPTGWYVGNSAGAKTTALSQISLGKRLTANEYLRSRYCDKYWTQQQPGLYDAKGNLLCSWEDSGIDVENDKECGSEETDSAHYVLTNRYPTTTKVIIPNGVTSIASEAFCSCDGLENIIIPNSVTSIGDYAFDYCSGLTSITIPSSVTSIGYGAFYDCSKLTIVSFGELTGWYVGDSPGAKTIALKNTDLEGLFDKDTPATYLRSRYCDKYWTRY